jgi:hypothetical protein
MFINKIGYQHLELGLNNHDYGFEQDNIKCVVDGCSEGLHSEVGAKLFCHFYKNSNDNNDRILKIFQQLTSIFSLVEDIKNHLLFTILLLYENDNIFHVQICGDGIIIKQKHDDTLEYEIKDYSGSPPYFSYNFIDEKYLTKYKDGVLIGVSNYWKTDYKAIGIASDGLQYILDSPFKEEFENLLIKRKEFAIKRLINREHKLFKDDITIAI